MSPRPAPGAVLLAAAAAVAVTIALAVVATLAPSGAPIVALFGVAVAAGWAARRRLAQPLTWALAALALAALVLLVSVSPAAGLLAGVVGMLVAGQERLRRSPSAVLTSVAAAIGLPVLVIATVVWPSLVALASLVVAILLLAARAPAWALVAAILLVGFEGSVKVLVGAEAAAFGVSNRTVGAAAIDLALFAAVAGVLVGDRGRTPRRLWELATRAERAAIVLFGLWLALSVGQIAQNSDLASGLKGFRLVQAYTAVALAAGLVAWWAGGARTARVVLGVGLAVVSYAAVRVVVGPADSEVRHALSFRSTTAYGQDIRAVGSFSGATGLSSYVTPLVVFGLVLAFGAPRLRRASVALSVLGLVGLLASYGRAPLVAVAAGLAFALLVVFGARDVAGRTKLLAMGVVVAALTLTSGGLYVASLSSPLLQERAEGILDPGGDESLSIRFDTWKEAVELVRERPLGRGVGSVGAVTERQPGRYLVADNSFLKVAVEQGIAGGLLFVAALLAAITVLLRRLRRTPAEARLVGLAALAGFVAFLCLSITGEYVEQPGKVVAWALLGIAAAQAFRRPDTSEGRAA